MSPHATTTRYRLGCRCRSCKAAARVARLKRYDRATNTEAARRLYQRRKWRSICPRCGRGFDHRSRFVACLRCRRKGRVYVAASRARRVS